MHEESQEVSLASLPSVAVGRSVESEGYEPEEGGRLHA